MDLFDEEAKRTKAQLIYHEIYKNAKNNAGNLNPNESHREYSQRFNPLQDITNIFPDEDCKLIINALKEQQNASQEDIKQSTSKLYHFSNVSPDKFEGDTLHKKELLTMYEEDLVNASFASPNELSMYPLQVEGVSNYFCGFSPNPEDKFAILSSKNEFLQYKKENPTSYGYEVVNPSDFTPTVSLSGNFSNEFYSEKDAKISKDNCIELTVEEMMKRGVQIFFVKDNQAVTNIVNELGNIQGGGNKFDKLLEMSKQGKVDYYNQEVGINNELESARYKVKELRKRLNREGVAKPPYKAKKTSKAIDPTTLKLFKEKYNKVY